MVESKIRNLEIRVRFPDSPNVLYWLVNIQYSYLFIDNFIKILKSINKECFFIKE